MVPYLPSWYWGLFGRIKAKGSKPEKVDGRSYLNAFTIRICNLLWFTVFTCLWATWGCLHLAVSRDHYPFQRFTHLLRESKWWSLACGFKISAVGPYFLLYDYQEAFHCCLVVACINRINMISIQCHRVGQWWAGKPEFENLLVSGRGKSCVYSL